MKQNTQHRTHYNILHEGRRAQNKKEAKQELKCGDAFFKTLLKRGLVKRVDVEDGAKPTITNAKEVKHENNGENNE